MDENVLQACSTATVDDLFRELVICTLDELRPHPSYARHQLRVPTSTLSALAAQGDLAFREPLAITRERTIVDGYARYELARQQGRQSLPCFEHELSEAEALQWILATHRQSKGLNDFTRILLALDLEPSLKEKARAHQRAGGEVKGSSNLTEAERLDVRSAIAASAGVSVGNVTKVKQLKTIAHKEVLAALQNGHISIHRAWTWCKQSPKDQLWALCQYRSERGINKKIRHLTSRHQPTALPELPDTPTLIEQLSTLESDRLGAIKLACVQAPGNTIFVTEGLLSFLSLHLNTCTTRNH